MENRDNKVQRRQTSQAKSKMNRWKTEVEHERRWANKQEVIQQHKIHWEQTCTWSQKADNYLVTISYESIYLYGKIPALFFLPHLCIWRLSLSDYVAFSFKFHDLISYSQHCIILFTHIFSFWNRPYFRFSAKLSKS